jgi:hypothetical protein
MRFAAVVKIKIREKIEFDTIYVVFLQNKYYHSLQTTLSVM